MKKVGIYLRVSTGEQNTQNQLAELQAVADRCGYHVVDIYEDAGVSGAKGRDERLEFDRLLKDAVRRKFDLIMAWSVDRLGRSLSNLVEFLSEVHEVGVDLYLHQQGIDTTTPSGKAMFGMLGVFAEFERAMIQERVKAGIQRARAEGKQVGRRALSKDKEQQIINIRRASAGQVGKKAIARRVGCGVGTVIRVLKAAGVD